MVSRYVVDWVEVGGLIAGLIGFFYLSLGLFPRSGLVLFRPLLPAGVGAIAGLMLSKLQIHPSSAHAWTGPLALSLTYYLYSLYVASDWIAKPRFLRNFFKSFQKVVQNRYVRSGVRSLIVPFALVGVLAVLSARYMPSTALPPHANRFGLGVGIALNTLAGILILLTPILSERFLQLAGFLLSAAAILTQFISPILDLLGVQIK